MRDLQSLLESDLDLTGWNLAGDYDVSADGTVIVGYGENSDGQFEGWVAVIPEPATLSLLAFGTLAILVRRDS